MNVKELKVKEVLKHWREYKAVLANMLLRIENEDVSDSVKEEYRLLKYNLELVENAIEALPELRKSVLKDIWFNGYKWDCIMTKYCISNNTINRYLNTSYETIQKILDNEV